MKTRQLLRMLASATITITMFTSCDLYFERDIVRGGTISIDSEQSYAFAGQWNGNWGMYYNYVWNGNVYQFNSYDTDIVFYPKYNGATYGWGRQVDWYDRGPYEGIQHEFNWEIRRGIVYLNYLSDASLDCWIRDYSMTYDYFKGYFGDTNSYFNLRKISDYYNWGVYTTSYCVIGEIYDWRFGYSKTRSGDASAASSDSNAYIVGKSDQPNGTIIYGSNLTASASTIAESAK